MSKWKMVRLGDVGRIQSGFAFKSELFVKNDVPIIRIGNLNGIYVDIDNDVCYPQSFLKENRIYSVQFDDILIALSGATVGKIGIYKHNDLALLNQRVGKIVINQDVINNTYVYWFVKSNSFLRQIKNQAMGCAQPNISNKQIEKIKIPLPPLETQKHIAKTLDTASELIALHKKQLAELDNLIKSTFYDMFGDPVTNDMGWEIQKLSLLTQKITDGTHQSPAFVSKGIPFLFISNIVDNKITYDTSKFISRQTYEELIKRTPVELGDILLTIVGSYGNPAIVTELRPFCFQRHIAYIKPDFSKVSPQYLHSAFLSDYVRNQIEKRVKGIAQKTLNLSELKEIKIPVAPLTLQQKFADIVTKIEEQKDIVKKAIDESQYLFDSLMSEYFE